MQTISSKTIGIIVPGYNVGQFGAATLRTIINASLRSDSGSIILVAVDDGSTDNTNAAFSSIKRELSNNPVQDIVVEVVSHRFRMGYSQAIKSGLTEIFHACPTCNLVSVYPGNDQVEGSSVSNLFDNSQPNTICIGYRQNKRQARPFLKWLFSEILQITSRLLVFPNLKDLTGNFVVPPQLLFDCLKSNPGHAWPLRLSRLILESQLPVIQIPIYLKRDFKKRSRSQGLRRYPRSSDMRDYAKSFVSEILYLKKTSQLRSIRKRFITTVKPIETNRDIDGDSQKVWSKVKKPYL